MALLERARLIRAEGSEIAEGLLRVADRLSHPRHAYLKKKTGEPATTLAYWCDRASDPNLGIIARVRFSDERRRRYLGIASARFIIFEEQAAYSTLVHSSQLVSYGDYDRSILGAFEDYLADYRKELGYWAQDCSNETRKGALDKLKGRDSGSFMLSGELMVNGL